MTTIRQMLPQVAQPFTEAIIGAGLGALVSRFVLKGDMSTGAIVGGVAGYGMSLTRAKGAFPFTATAGGAYVGDSVSQYPTFQQGYAQPYGGMGQQQQMMPQQQEVYEEVIPEVVEEFVPERRHHRHEDWWRRGGGYGRGWGHGGWGHGWRR